MAVIVKREQKEFVLHPAGGPYPAVLAQVRLHEGVQTQFGLKDRLQLIFQTTEKARDHIEGVEDDRPMSVSLFCNLTLNDKSQLRDLLAQQLQKGQLDQVMRQAKAGGVDVEQLLRGTQWLLQVVHNEAEGRMYANISGAMRGPTDQQIPIWEDDRVPS